MVQHIRIFKMVLEYDGSEFCGWQMQPNQRTVQDEVEKAIFSITGENVRVTGAGRTDAGVHALGQVASFQSTKTIPENRLHQAFNAVLPNDIRVVQLEETKNPFDARRDAVSRTYGYAIAKRRRAIGRQYAWYPKLRYNLEPMIAASEALRGRHCWKAFCKTKGQERDFLSTVLDVRWNVEEHEIRFTITAERFFHNMVRIILGTLFEVGRGKITIGEFQNLLNLNDRTRTGTTLPPHGLFLVRVDYR